MGLLVHGIRKLYARQFLGQQVLDVGSIGTFYILTGDDACGDRSVSQRLGCTRTRHHNLRECDGVALEVVQLLVVLGMDTQR